MFKFETVIEFISTLDKNKKLLSQLFDKRNISLRLGDVLDTVEEEQLRKLINSDLVSIDDSDNFISLDESLIEFFEAFLNVQTTIDVGKASGIIDNIKENIQYYLDEKRKYKQKEYLQAIKKELKKANKVLIQQIRLLHINIEQVYKTETNLKIKLAKLKKFRTQRGIIQKTHTELDRILKGDIFFRKVIDAELQIIVINLRQALVITTQNLLNIQHNVIDYLNKAKQQNASYEKLQLVKSLRDKADLRAKSNFETILENENVLFFTDNISIRTRLSLPFLQIDEGQKVILKADKHRKHKRKMILKLAQPIDNHFFEDTEALEHYINIKQLKNTYEAQGGDLFTFIQSHDFGHPVAYRNRINLFCKMISLFDNDFIISDEMSQDDNGISYAKVQLK